MSSKKRLDISIHEIEGWCQALLTHLRENYDCASVVLEEDYFWHIATGELFDMEHDPTPDIGSLAETLDLLRDDFHSPDDLTGDDLELLSRLLRAIAIAYPA